MSDLIWKTTPGLTPYPSALSEMESHVQGIIDGQKQEMVWLLEHPPLYTAGTSAKAKDLLAQRFPVYDAGRGGEYTYHGPGQRIAYVMLDLKTRKQMDVRAYVARLEQWLIATLAEFHVEAFTRQGRIGVWVIDKSGQEAKIAALGIRIRKWVTFHGIALNISPDLSHYTGIVPCGISDYGVTSLAKLGVNAGMDDVDAALKNQFHKIF